MAEVVFHCTGCGFAHKVEGAAIPPAGVRGSCRGCAAVLTVFPGGRVEGPPPVAPPVEVLPPPPEAPPESASAVDQTVLAGSGFPGRRPPQPLRPGYVPFACPYCGSKGERQVADLSPSGTPSVCGTCAQGFLLFPDGRSTGEDGASAAAPSVPSAPATPAAPAAPEPPAGAQVMVPCPFCGAPNERAAASLQSAGSEVACPLCAMSYRAFPDGRVEGPPQGSPHSSPPAAAGAVAFRCPYCGAGGERAASDLSPGGTRSVCGTCVQYFVTYPDGRTEEVQEPPPPAAAPPPPAAAAAPAPLPPGVLLFTCPTCGRESRVPKEKIPPGGAKARCKGCENRWLLLPDGRTQPADQPPPTDASTRWEVRLGDQSMGPFRLMEMQDLQRAGSLRGETFVRPPGGDWMAAAKFPVLAALFAPKPAPAAGAPAPQQVDPERSPEGEEPFPEGPLGDLDHCYAHPGALPLRVCTNCNKHLCEACAPSKTIEGHIRPITVCGACGGPTIEVEKRRRWPAFHTDMGKVLLAPLQGVGLMYFGFLVGMDLTKALALRFGLVFGLVLAMILTVIQWTYLLAVIREVADGSYDIPSWPDVSNYGEMLVRFLKVIFVTFVATAPVIVAACFFGTAAVTGAALNSVAGGQGLFAGATLLVLVFAVIVGFFYLFYLPMSVGIVAVFDTVLPALNPVIIFRVLFRIGTPWLYAVGLWVAFTALELGGALAFSKIPVLGAVLNAGLSSYVTLVSCYVLGRVLAENEHKIGWA